MNAAIVARTLSLIPERVSRLQTGSIFDPAAPCAHPERVAHLLQFLSWLGPLQPLTKDDLRVLGLLTPYAKPAIALADEDAEVEEEAAGASEEIAPVVAQPPAAQSEATLP
jgi:hypothetical protein